MFRPYKAIFRHLYISMHYVLIKSLCCWYILLDIFFEMLPSVFHCCVVFLNVRIECSFRAHYDSPLLYLMMLSSCLSKML
jgi:hypothetical protein